MAERGRVNTDVVVTHDVSALSCNSVVRRPWSLASTFSTNVSLCQIQSAVNPSEGQGEKVEAAPNSENVEKPANKIKGWIASPTMRRLGVLLQRSLTESVV
jgi:hypothetical protein